MDEKSASKALLTQELMKMLGSGNSFDCIVNNAQESITNPDTPVYLAQLLKKHGMSIQDVIRKANLSQSFGYQVFNGRRNPTRNVLLRMAFAMKLSVDETQRLLKIAQRGELYPRVRRDAAVIFCLERNCSLCDAEELLESIGEAPLS